MPILILTANLPGLLWRIYSDEWWLRQERYADDDQEETDIDDIDFVHNRNAEVPPNKLKTKMKTNKEIITSNLVAEEIWCIFGFQQW